MNKADKLKKLSYNTIIVAIIYSILGLISGFWVTYLMITGEVPKIVISAHSHFLCMSGLIGFVGLAMNAWANGIDEYGLVPSMRRNKISVVLLALGSIISFLFMLIQIPQPSVIGYALYFIGFTIFGFNWIKHVKVRKQVEQLERLEQIE